MNIARIDAFEGISRILRCTALPENEVTKT